MTTANLKLYSPTGAYLSDLTDGRAVPPGPRIACDSAGGPVTFLLDGRLIRTEAAPPFCPNGDVAGVPVPLDLTLGPHTLCAIAWSTPVAVASAQFSVLAPTPAPTPVPTPTPAPTPTPPPPVVVVTDPQLPDDALKVPPSRSIQAALDVAKVLDGQTIALQRGAKYGGGWRITRGNGLTICAYGDPKLPAPLVTSPADGNGLDIPRDAVLKGLTLRGLAFRPPDRTPGVPGFRLTSKGDGVAIMGRVDGLTLDGLDVAYYRQNVAIDGDCSDVLISGLRTAFAWAQPTPDGNQATDRGQGLYLACPRGPVKITGGAFYHNGWHEILPAHARNIFRHNCYVQKTCARPTVTGCAFVDGGSFGIELRPGGTLDGCYFQGNAFAACSFGQWSVRNSVIVATGGRHWTGSGWVGNGGLYSWADSLAASDTVLAYVQQPVPNKANKEFDAAAFTLSNSYPAPHADWASSNPKLSAAAVTVRGFPQLADFPGKNEPASIPGVTLKPGALARPAWMDTAGVDLLAGRVTAADLIKRIRDAAA